jgi:hypothetical protein
MKRRDNIIKWAVISIFVLLYLGVSVISTIHVIDFFRLSNPEWLAVTLAIAFEVGAAASLAAIIILDRTSRWMVWSLFLIITAMQMMGNMYYAFTHLIDFQSWSELFGINEEEVIFQKRILSIVSGAILPIVALGFIKSLVDYIRPEKTEDLKEDFDKKIEIEKEIQREEKIEEEPKGDEVNELDEAITEAVEDEKESIQAIKEDETLSEKEKTRRIEQKIRKALLNNRDLKDKVVEEIKRIEDEDKYPKEPTPAPRIYGGM